jgi:hypothetical protein
MLIALIVVALVAVGLLVVLLSTRSSAAEFRSQAEARESALVAERDRLTEANGTLTKDLATVRGDLDRSKIEVGGLKAEVAANVGTIRQLEADAATAAAEAASVVAELQTRVDNQSAEIAALVADNNSMHERATAAEAAKVEAEEAAADAEARNTGAVVGAVASVDGTDPAALWQLELVRSERTWRTSVAVDPSAEQGPFAVADDPVRLAVEITAAALREDVGAFISLDWQVPPIEEPAKRHLVVRVAQEMLEAAARTPEPLRLVVTGDQDVQLRLEPTDPDTDVIKVPQPRLTDDLIVVNEAASMTVTVTD